MNFGLRENTTRKLILFLVAAIIVIPQVFRPGTRWSLDYDGVTLSGKEYNSPLYDTLPHHEYKRIEDSLERIETMARMEYNNHSSWKILRIGISKKETAPQEYFFDIHGYRLKEHVEVKPAGHHTNIQYPVWIESTRKSRILEGNLEEKIVPVKYFEEEGLYKDRVAIPISKTSYKIINISSMIIVALMIVLSIYFFIALPFRILVMISRGQPFHPDTIKSLYRVGWFLIIISLLNSFSSILFHLLFHKRIPEEFEFSYYANLVESFPMIAIGLVIFLFANAFKQGYNLQEEQDLTV